jgi:hypothetical protein
VTSAVSSFALGFERDVHDAVIQRLEHDPADRPALEAMSAWNLLVLYLNWYSRYIYPRPHEVSQSWEFTANPLRWDPRYRDALDHIIDALKTGGNVNPHLSEDVKYGYEGSVRRARRRNPDLDLLLNDWGVHHLHLSLEPGRDGFRGRTKDLLFVMVGRDQAFVLDIFPHRAFSREKVAHIMIDNWPGANFVHRKGDIVWAPSVSDAERDTRRKAGIDTGWIQRNGAYYKVGLGGISGAGTSVRHARQVNDIFRGLADFEQHVCKQPEFITNAISTRGLSVPATPDLHFIIRSDGWFAIREENTRTLFDIPGVPRDPP